MLGRLWRKRNHCSVLVGRKTGIATMENSMMIPQKIKNRIVIWPSNTSFGYQPPKFENIYLQRSMHYVHCSTIHDGQDMETIEVPFNRWLDKEDMVHVYMEYYSAIRKNEMLTFAITWMDLRNIMLSEISQTEKVKDHMVSLMWDIKLKATNE